MSRRDRAAAGLLLFFIVCAVTLELYWLLHHDRLAQRDDLLARAFAFYGRGDRGYYNHVSTFEIGLESFHVLFTQVLHVCVLAGILWRKLWRNLLQLVVGSYVCYSTALYLVANHVSGYAEMPRHDLASFLIFYLPNLPWLLGNGWLAWDAGERIASAFRKIEAAG
jgi:hypothetical protein